MIKIVSMWKRNPDLSEEECERHYLNAHTALAKKALDVPGFRKYVQNKIVKQTVFDYNNAEKAMQVEPEFDRFVELYFDDMESFNAAMGRPEMMACFNDHANFMNINIPRNLVIYEVSEAVPMERKD